MTIGIFGGSFNPIHIGHAVIASYISETEHVDEVWFVVSPQNPLKSKEYEASFEERLDMCEMVTNCATKLSTCDIENHLQPPYYTIKTLYELQKRYPEHQFKLIIGADNLLIFHKWKDYQRIIDDFGIIVYPRPGYDMVMNENLHNNNNIFFVEAPLIEISSTEIRDGIRKEKDMQFYMHASVNDYIKRKKLYIK